MAKRIRVVSGVTLIKEGEVWLHSGFWPWYFVESAGGIGVELEDDGGFGERWLLKDVWFMC